MTKTKLLLSVVAFSVIFMVRERGLRIFTVRAIETNISKFNEPIVYINNNKSSSSNQLYLLIKSLNRSFGKNYSYSSVKSKKINLVLNLKEEEKEYSIEFNLSEKQIWIFTKYGFLRLNEEELIELLNKEIEHTIKN